MNGFDGRCLSELVRCRVLVTEQEDHRHTRAFPEYLGRWGTDGWAFLPLDEAAASTVERYLSSYQTNIFIRVGRAETLLEPAK